ncbi:MAG TPA: site-2 protease family protein [Planctomycetota bacterium]|nr:site-2 protease family protein [Planctomycetota bacterium]
MNLNWSFRIFTIFGIPIRVHWTLILVWVIYLLRPLVQGGGGMDVLWVAAGLLILNLHILLHELGHCWGARHVGEDAEQILLWPLGGMAYVGHSENPKRDMIITAAGPSVTVILGILTAVALGAVGIPWNWGYLNPFDTWWPFGLGFGGLLLLWSLKLAVVLAAFNLLVPAFPFDGGRLLLSYLTLHNPTGRAMLISSTISMPIGIVLIVWGVLQNELLLSFIGLNVVFEALNMRRMVVPDEAYSIKGYSDRGYRFEEPRKEGYFAKRRRLKREREVARRDAEVAELKARVDELLDKVNRVGMANLSPSERKALEDASARLRGRS